jgi:hypothetical protein
MGVESLALLAGGLQVAQGVQSFQQNRAMAQATKAETAANVANQQEAFKVNRARLVREQEQFAGKQTVTAAGSGATLGSFDPLFADTAQQSSLDLALLEYDKNLNIANTQYQGQMKKKAYYREGRSQLLSGITKGATSMATSSATGGGLYGGGSSTYSDGTKINWYAQ